jgi:flagellar basal-body rod protein FlgF
MDHLIYTAMNGAKQVMLKQATNSHNLANLNTTGFRADLDAFKSLPVYGPGHPTRVYNQDLRAGTDLSSGQIITTGNELDVAIRDKGFIAVQDKDGMESMTRRGDLHISSAGLMETGDGDPVMGNSGPIAVPPHEKLEIAADGTISIRPLGQSAAALAVVDRIKLVNPQVTDIKKTESGLLRLESDEEMQPDTTVQLLNGSLESSNVSSMEAMVNMIELAREFELHIKMMKEAKDTDAAAASIVRMG